MALGQAAARSVGLSSDQVRRIVDLRRQDLEPLAQGLYQAIHPLYLRVGRTCDPSICNDAYPYGPCPRPTMTVLDELLMVPTGGRQDLAVVTPLTVADDEVVWQLIWATKARGPGQ